MGKIIFLIHLLTVCILIFFLYQDGAFYKKKETRACDFGSEHTMVGTFEYEVKRTE